MAFGGEWVKDFIQAARGPLNEAVERSLKDAEASARRVVDDTLPKVQALVSAAAEDVEHRSVRAADQLLREVDVRLQETVRAGLRQVEGSARDVVDDTLPKVGELVAATVDDAEGRARRIVEASLRQTYAYLDDALATTERRLSNSLEVAGGELRGAAADAVLRLEQATARTIERLERDSVARLEEAIQRSVEASVRNTRQELQALLAFIGRQLLGVYLPLPMLVFLWRVSAAGAAAAPWRTIATSVALLAASAASVALAGRLKQTRRALTGHDQPLAFGAALAGYAPFALMGAVAAVAALLGG